MTGSIIIIVHLSNRWACNKTPRSGEEDMQEEEEEEEGSAERTAPKREHRYTFSAPTVINCGHAVTDSYFDESKVIRHVTLLATSAAALWKHVA